MGTAVLVGAPLARATSTVSVWGLDPDGGHDSCGCSACAACRAHALNKIFASAADADRGRAHPHCRCVVAQLSVVEPHVFEALFVSGGRRSSVDRRWQWVQAALASAPPVPTPQSASSQPTANDAAMPETVTGSSPHRQERGTAAGATIRAAWIRRLAPGRRALFVQLDTTGPIEVDIRLLFARSPLLRRRLATANGRQTFQIPLPTAAPPGPAQLHVRLTDTAGARQIVTRMLSVPAVQPRR
jgi:hypothetical protein